MVIRKTHHVDDLSQRQPKRHIERVAGIEGGAHSQVVVAHQVSNQAIFMLVSFDYLHCKSKKTPVKNNARYSLTMMLHA